MKNILPLVFAPMLVISVMPFTAVTAYAKAVTVKTEQTLKEAISAGGEVQMSRDIDLTDVLHIPEWKEVTLDLNGKMLNRGLAKCQDLGSVIRVEPGATLTVTDSSDNNAGIITGGASWNGGIYNAGSMSLRDAPVISDNENDDVYLNSGKKITLGRDFSHDSKIYVNAYRNIILA